MFLVDIWHSVAREGAKGELDDNMMLLIGIVNLLAILKCFPKNTKAFL